MITLISVFFIGLLASVFGTLVGGSLIGTNILS